MVAVYVQPHVTQFDGHKLQNEACAPASCANGVAASTGGRLKPSAETVHNLVPKSQESSPGPGWSQADCDKAMGKLGVPYTSISGWDAVEKAHNDGLYCVLAGDSDRFSNSTCSGVFDGNHSIGCHPNEKTVDGVEFWWIDDPICKTGRWERKSTLKAYAQKFSSNVIAGRFDTKVPATAYKPPAPKPPAKPPTVVLRYGGQKLTPRQIKRIKVPSGRRANIRTRPDRIRKGDVTGTLANGKTMTCYQRTTRGVSLGGSRVWYGNQSGTRWTHSSSF